MPISLDTVRTLAKLLRDNDLAELTLERGDEFGLREPGDAPPFRLSLQRGDAVVAPPVAVAAPAAPQPAPVPSTSDATPAPEDGALEITAPAVGVFRPAQPPVQPGDAVRAGQTIGVVEALKIPTEIKAPRSGKVRALLVAEGAGMEYGQVLLTLELDNEA